MKVHVHQLRAVPGKTPMDSPKRSRDMLCLVELNLLPIADVARTRFPHARGAETMAVATASTVAEAIVKNAQTLRHLSAREI